MTVIVKEDAGHYPLASENLHPVVDFITEKSLKPRDMRRTEVEE